MISAKRTTSMCSLLRRTLIVAGYSVHYMYPLTLVMLYKFMHFMRKGTGVYKVCVLHKVRY